MQTVLERDRHILESITQRSSVKQAGKLINKLRQHTPGFVVAGNKEIVLVSCFSSRLLPQLSCLFTFPSVGLASSCSFIILHSSAAPFIFKNQSEIHEPYFFWPLWKACLFALVLLGARFNLPLSFPSCLFSRKLIHTFTDLLSSLRVRDLQVGTKHIFFYSLHATELD